MMDHLTYATKSPEKSSPSFPEDVEDEDEDPMAMDHLNFASTPTTEKRNGSNDNVQVDVTMLPEDEEDEIETSRNFMLSVDSPRHPTDSSEKKVHWSNQNVQTLLDCVEKHLDEFNVQKKHKQVWQTIGVEMESLGFTMEHCYNKWKNLRRDVRLLVNNPQKAVRNADILRRVARLILVIYPNIDATTMQVTGDRMGGKSTPTTPAGSGNLSNRVTLPSALHAPDSPLYYNVSRARTPHSVSSGIHTFTPNGTKHKSDQHMHESPVPGTALFTNRRSESETHFTNSDPTEANSNNTNSGFPFFFNPAAAALLVQSQLFNDLLRHQNQSSKNDDTSHLDSVQQRQQLFATGTNHKNLVNIAINPATTISTNDDRCHQEVNAPQPNSLVTNLFNGFSSVDGSNYANLLNSAEVGLNTSTLDRLPPGSELAGVVERLRNEETVHMRLTDLVTHLADELRVAGMRRRATLDQLLEIVQGTPRISSSMNQTPKASDTSHRV